MSLFGSLKSKLSRKGSNPLSPSDPSKQSTRNSLPTPQSNNPFTSASPPTRRPGRSGMNAFSTPSNEAPPPYTPRPANPTGSDDSNPAVAPTFNAAPGKEDPYSSLGDYDTIFLIDDSGSMAGRSWRETAEALKAIAPICADHDADGIDIYFLNHPDSDVYKNVTHKSTVHEIFSTVRPGGGTPTGKKLSQILRNYLNNFERNPNIKPANIIVITDGEPSDDPESELISAARKLDKLDAPMRQLGVQFLQVGNEPGAREYLKQLDDGLKDIAGDVELRDIVDTVPWTSASGGTLTAQGILKCVLGAVNRRIDRNSSEMHR